MSNTPIDFPARIPSSNTPLAILAVLLTTCSLYPGFTSAEPPKRLQTSNYSPASAALVESPQAKLLVRDLENRDSFVAREAVASLISLGVEAVPSLVEGLQSDNLMVRRRSAHALSHIGPTSPQHVQVLTSALHDSDFEIRRRAALALGRGKPGDGAIAALVAALKDPDMTVRMSAAVALGDIAPDATDAAKLLDEKTQIRNAAREALRKLMSPEQQNESIGKRNGAKP